MILRQWADRLGLTVRESRSAPWWKEISDIAHPATASKISVNADVALTFSAVFRAVSLISGILASAPVRVERRTGDRMSLVNDHPLVWLLNVAAAPEISAMSVREALTAYALLHGTGYARIHRVGAEVDRLELLHTPDVEWDEDKEVFFVQSTKEVVDPYDMFVIANVSLNGVTGLSTIRLAREAIALGLAAERSGAQFFSESQVPLGVLTHPARLSKEAEAQIRESWRARMQNRHEIAILQEGVKFERISLPAEDAQFLTTRQFQVEDIARWFGLPPYMLGGMKAGGTAQSAEAQGEEFRSFTLLRWVRIWENQIRLKLLKVRERYNTSVRLDMTLFNRATAIERARIQSIQVQTGLRTRNECRLEDGYPTIDYPEADAILTPLNLMKGGIMNEPGNAASATGVGHTRPGGDLEQGAGISSDN